MEGIRSRRRVVEAVADGDDTLDVPGAADDGVSLCAGLRPADDGGHPGRHVIAAREDIEIAGQVASWSIW